MATSVEESKKRSRSIIFKQISIIWCKIGPVDPEIIGAIKKDRNYKGKIYRPIPVGKFAERVKYDITMI